MFLIDYSIVDVYPEKKLSYPEIFRILISEDIGIEPSTTRLTVEVSTIELLEQLDTLVVTNPSVTSY